MSPQEHCCGPTNTEAGAVATALNSRELMRFGPDRVHIDRCSSAEKDCLVECGRYRSRFCIRRPTMTSKPTIVGNVNEHELLHFELESTIDN